MRPDRLVVGEVRGGEVRELLTALNTGHAGAGTVHANSARDLPSRLHALGALAGLQPAAVEAHLRSAVDVVIAMAREGAVRRVVEVSVLRPDGPDGVHCVPALASARPGVLVRGPAWAVLEARLDRQGRGGS
jgi:pilus assembly protein CpaF